MKSNFKMLIMMYAGLIALGIASPENVHGAAADHLIISEFMVKTRNPYTMFGSPFIEIANPTASDIDLSQVYVTDAIQPPMNFYYNITLSDINMADPGGGTGGDFHAKFPDGYILAGGTSLAISINGSEQYFEAYGQQPDFELFEDGETPDAIPEMVEAFPGAINANLTLPNVPVLSDLSESLVLYSWDGTDNLVQDLDYVTWGSNTALRVDKTGVTIGTSSYLADTAVGDQEPTGTAAINFRQGYRRVDTDEGTEIVTGGNGISGHDETSENMASTWSLVDFSVDGYGIPAAPGFFHPTAPIVQEGGFFPVDPFEGQAVALSVTLATEGTISAITFFVSIDGGSFNPNSGTDNGAGVWTYLLDSQNEGASVRWYAEVTNSGGGTVTHPVAAPLYFSSWVVDEAPDLSGYPTKLLITEVCTKGSTDEFVEIYNPSPGDVDMSDYYLGDAVYSPNDQGYWNIGSGEPIPNIGGGIYTDFQARFPDGFMLAAGDTIVVSIAGSGGFSAGFGFLPDLELYEDDAFPDNVPDMRPVFETADGNSIITTAGGNPSTPTLTNGSESIQLYHYVQGEDLVTDIDLFVWGTSASVLFSKTGKTVGSSTYLPDTPVGSQEPFYTEADFGYSYQRVDASEGSQIGFGSNGVLGRDETSENLMTTFELREVDPARSPVPGSWQNIWPESEEPGTPANHAWGDVDQDGFDDLYLVNSQIGVANKLYTTMGPGLFVENTPDELQSLETDQMAAWADLYNDQDLDLMVARSPGQNICYENLLSEEGSGFLSFSDGGMQADNQSSAAAWIDYDHDGYLEVFVANENSAAQLLSSQYGFLDSTPEDLRFTDGCRNFAWCDYDVDMDPDLCVITATGQVRILENVGSDQFNLVTLLTYPNSTNCAWADYDNDGDFDLVVTTTNQGIHLFHNLGPDGFQTNPLPGVDRPFDSREAVWGDFDKDGFQDIFIANYGSENLLLHNDAGTGNFTPVSDGNDVLIANCAAVSWSDVDHDGDLDLFLSGLPYNQLLQNNLGYENHYLSLRLKGNGQAHRSNLSAIGALIKVSTQGQTQWRNIAGDGSTMVQFFGLGEASIVEELTVYWPFKMPDGSHHTTRLLDVGVDQMLEIEEPLQGVTGVPDVEKHLPFAMQPCHPNPFNPLTNISFNVPESSEIDLEVFDVAGRKVRTLHFHEMFEAGQHIVPWNGTDNRGHSLASGIYHIRLKTRGFEKTQRVTLIK